ncbi:MAG: hypothetical protein ACRDP8_19720 [Actinopolymorphaceae bacterium]
MTSRSRWLSATGFEFAWSGVAEDLPRDRGREPAWQLIGLLRDETGAGTSLDGLVQQVRAAGCG